MGRLPVGQAEGKGLARRAWDACRNGIEAAVLPMLGLALNRIDRSSVRSLADRPKKRDKLFALYYAEKILGRTVRCRRTPADGRHRCAQNDRVEVEAQAVRRGELTERFEQVAAILRDVDVEAMWTTATDARRASWCRNSSRALRCSPDHRE
jgi:hypothetical protein